MAQHRFLQNKAVKKHNKLVVRPYVIMSTVDKKKDTTTPKTALELLEEDDEFEVGKKLI